MSKNWRISDKELQYVKEVLESGFPGSSTVNFTDKLEAAFAKKFNCEYALTFTNGTATLHAALAAAGVEEGDEVIVPPLTMSATSLAVLFQGAKPIFADIDPETWTIDPVSIKEKITSKTKAIIPVAIYGLSPDMDPIMELANEHNLVVIEDDAQCFLGKYKGRMVGSIGHISSFSFQNSKHMTCGEGGMVITNDEKLAEDMRRFSSLGYGLVSAKPGHSKIDKKDIVHPSFKRHVSLGFNYRLSEICAAVLMGQFERLDEFVAARQNVAKAFEQVISNCSWLKAQKVPAEYEHSYWAYTVMLDVDEEGLWDKFYDKFIENGGDWFYGAWGLTYQEPMFQSGDYGVYEKGICPVAEKIQPRLIQLKTHYGDQKTIDQQVEALEKTIKHF